MGTFIQKGMPKTPWAQRQYDKRVMTGTTKRARQLAKKYSRT